MEMEEQKKRKTHTSSEVKNRYNAKAYKRFQTLVKPDLYEQIDRYMTQEGINKVQFLQRAIQILIEEKAD